MAKLENVKTLDMVNGEITKVEYDGEVYVKVDGLAEKGDLALANEWVVDTTAGTYYEVMMTYNHGADEFTYSDDVNDEQDRDMNNYFTFFRKQSAPSLDERVSVLETKVATLEGENPVAETIEELITHNGVEYKLVDRKAQAGDVVVFTENTSCYFKLHTPYGPVNERLSVDSDGFGLSRVYFSVYNRTPNNVKVYEPVALKVGDYVKVIREIHGHGFSIGDIVELAGDGYNPEFMALRITDNKGRFVSREEIIRATDEEVAEAKAQAEQAAVEAKWASIGRKPNEFKKGDIVRLTQGTGANEKGEIVTLAADDADRYHDEEGDVYGCDASWVELITPVESRFDHA